MATTIPIKPTVRLQLKNIATPPIKQASAKILIMPPLGTNTSAIIKAAHAKYKKTAKTSQPISSSFIKVLRSLRSRPPQSQNVTSQLFNSLSV